MSPAFRQLSLATDTTGEAQPIYGPFTDPVAAASAQAINRSSASTIIFQTILFALTAYKFIQAVRSGWGDIPLVQLLMRDGTWAFFLLFMVYAGQIGLYAQPNSAYAGVLYGWLLTFFSFCGYRILLNLNRLAQSSKPNSRATDPTRNTDTNLDIQLTTRPFQSGLGTSDPQAEESYELSPRRLSKSPEDSRLGARTFDTSHISTLSLGR